MSLEQKIEELTKAVETLTKALGAGGVTSTAKTKPDPKPEVKKEDVKEEPALETGETETIDGITLEELTESFKVLIKKDVAQARAIMTSFKIARLPEAEADQYPALKEAIDKALA